MVLHRRAGKTVGTINDVIKKALECPLENGRYAYIAPFLKQAKAVAWDYLVRFTEDVRIDKSETELSVTLLNGAKIRLYGADNVDALRGIYLDGVILDEYADMAPSMWSKILRPALSDRKGWAVFIGTPKGRNGFCQIYELSKRSSEWFCLLARASETGLIDKEELEDARSQMSEDEFEQEFECSFQASIKGSYYGKQLNDAEADGRIGSFPYSPSLPVYTAWDIGIGDSTAIWFYQKNGRMIDVIDYLEASGVGLEWYAKELKEKPYTYTNDNIFPHDMANKELSSGLTRQESLSNLGLRGVILPKMAVDEGIHMARNILHRCRFDESKCDRGLQALRHYSLEWDERIKDFKKSPKHDWSSHGADSFRYLAMGFRESEVERTQTRGHLFNQANQANTYDPFSGSFF